MEIEAAEQHMKTLAHSEQHYFKRYVILFFCYQPEDFFAARTTN